MQFEEQTQSDLIQHDNRVFQRLQQMAMEDRQKLVQAALDQGYRFEELPVLVDVLNREFTDGYISVFHEQTMETCKAVQMLESWVDQEVIRQRLH